MGRKRVRTWQPALDRSGDGTGCRRPAQRGDPNSFDSSPAIFTASRGRLADVRGLGRVIQMAVISAEAAAHHVLVHGTEYNQEGIATTFNGRCSSTAIRFR